MNLIQILYLKCNLTHCHADSPFSAYITFGSFIVKLRDINGFFQSEQPQISLGNGTVRAMDGHFSTNMVYWIDNVDKVQGLHYHLLYVV